MKKFAIIFFCIVLIIFGIYGLTLDFIPAAIVLLAGGMGILIQFNFTHHKNYFFSSLLFLLISLIIYINRGDGSDFNEKFILHLFWSLITAYIGFGLIFVGLIKEK